MSDSRYVQAVDEIGAGEVHEQGCFIVTTRWPDLDWRPHAGPATCGFCIKHGVTVTERVESAA